VNHSHVTDTAFIGINMFEGPGLRRIIFVVLESRAALEALGTITEHEAKPGASTRCSSVAINDTELGGERAMIVFQHWTPVAAAQEIEGAAHAS